MSEVTVLVPSYNHARYVERTLRSIFAQKPAPKNLIVIDDGSKDESVAVLERTLKDCPFASELIVRENRGLCATLNEALAKVETGYFAYISSDDLWLPEFLDRRVQLLESRPNAVLAYGYSFLIDDDDAIVGATSDWAEYSDGDVLQMLLFPVIPASASVLYRTAFLKETGWNEDAVLEDYELYLKLAARGEFALDAGAPLSAWRIHGTNTSGDFPLMMEEWLAAQRRTQAETGLTDAELDDIQTQIKFRCVADFVRRGHRAEAWKMFLENRGAGSLTSKLKMLARFGIPKAGYEMRRRTTAKQSRRRFGTIATGSAE